MVSSSGAYSSVLSIVLFNSGTYKPSSLRGKVFHLMNILKNDKYTSSRVHRVSDFAKRNPYRNFWRYIGLFVLLGFGSLSSLEATDYVIVKAYNWGNRITLRLNSNLNTVVIKGVSPSTFNNPVILKRYTTSGYTEEITIQPSSADGSDTISNTESLSVAVLSSVNTPVSPATDPYSYDEFYTVELWQGGVMLDNQTLSIGSDSGTLSCINGGSPKVVDIGAIENTYYLSPNPLNYWPDGKPSEPAPDLPTDEENQLADQAQGITDSGGFILPISPTEDMEIVLGMGGETDTLQLLAGEKYNLSISPDEGWDGNFSINGVDYTANDIKSHAKDDLGNFQYFFDSDIANQNHPSSTTLDTGVSVEQSGNGVLVLSYDSPDGNGGTLQQRVTYLVDRRSTINNVINGQDVAVVTVDPTKEASNDGDWDNGALASAADAIEAGVGSEPHETWLGDDAENLGVLKGDAINQLEEWRDLRPFESASLPRSTGYALNISMGDFGTITRNVPLNHTALTIARGITLAAFTFLLFSSFLKKLTI